MSSYPFDESSRILEENTPIVDRADVLLLCKEVDEDTPTAEIDEFINNAHIIVYDHIDGRGLRLNRLELIEKYLACHFTSITYAQATFESVGKLQNSFLMKGGLMLAQTRYGQQATAFDPTGELKKLNESKAKISARISWLGTTDKEQEAIAANETDGGC